MSLSSPNYSRQRCSPCREAARWARWAASLSRGHVFLCDTGSASVPRFNTGSLISFLSPHQREGWRRRWEIIEVSPLFRRRSFRSDPQFERPGEHFHANSAVAIFFFFFPRRFPNSFLQMMCHYKEVYLNKFNTSLINPRRAPFKRSHATSGQAPYNPTLPPPSPPHPSHHSISSRMEGRRATRGREGRELSHGQLILSKSLFTFLFSY